eukprot:TRINITY_DN4203_c0_g1_i2.p1 TRINITY_DN4203_c0_g1~~TRINITY_DN4203_c0_g1_i2.p1  ORF type:complete len:112 (-),score=77.57 TRINITY_DN4203_c0_g1_i2:193-528(-)
MRYVAAALLTALAGKDITAANIEAILSSVGVEVDKANLDIVVKNLAGKSIDELMAEGSTKLASMPAGGGGGAGGAAAPADGGAAPAEEKKEEKKEEEEEEEDDDMGFGLFD